MHKRSLLMPTSYERRKEYFKKYRAEHKEQMNENKNNWVQKQLQKKIKILEEVLGDKLNKDNVVVKVR